MLRYFLPETRVTLRAVLETVRDEHGLTLDSSATNRTATWSTYADQQFENDFTVGESVLHDHSAGFGFTADRRLTGVEASTESRVSEFVESALTVVTAAVGILPFDVASEGGDPSAAARRAGLLDRLGGDERARLNDLKVQLDDVRAESAIRRDGFVAAEPGTDAEQHLRRRITTLRHLERHLQADLAVARGELAARMAKYITTQTIESEFELRHLPVATPLEPQPTDGDDQPPPPPAVSIEWEGAATTGRGPDEGLTAKELWDLAGFTIARAVVSPNATEDTRRDGIRVRTPRRAVFFHVVRDPHVSKSQPSHGVIDEVTTRSVFDEGCPIETVPYEAKLFGKRTMKLSFDADGALTGIEDAATASAGEASSGLAKLFGSLGPKSGGDSS